MPADTFGHTPARQALELGDVYGLAFDEARAARPAVRLGIVGAGGVVQSKHLPAIWRLRTQWEPVTVEAIVEPDERVGQKVARLYGCRGYPDLPAMLAVEGLDALIVATPDDQHYPCALAGLEHNLHVLVMPNTVLFDEEFGGYTGMLEKFLKAVRGLEAPEATGWDGYHAYELNVATRLSILRRQPASLPLAAQEADAELASGLLPA